MSAQDLQVRLLTRTNQRSCYRGTFYSRKEAHLRVLNTRLQAGIVCFWHHTPSSKGFHKTTNFFSSNTSIIQDNNGCKSFLPQRQLKQWFPNSPLLRFEVLTAVRVLIAAFWDMRQCSLVDRDHLFERMFCLPLRLQRWSQYNSSKLWYITTKLHVVTTPNTAIFMLYRHLLSLTNSKQINQLINQPTDWMTDQINVNKQINTSTDCLVRSVSNTITTHMLRNFLLWIQKYEFHHQYFRNWTEIWPFKILFKSRSNSVRILKFLKQKGVH